MLMALLMAQTLSCLDLQTQMAMTQCAGEASQRADAAMNAQWTRTLAVMRKHDADTAGSWSRDQGLSYTDALLASQRAWLQYRDAECRVEGYAARGGTMQPMLIALCIEALTTDRVKVLAAAATPE